MARRQKARLVCLYVRLVQRDGRDERGRDPGHAGIAESVAAELRRDAAEQGARLEIDIVFVARQYPFTEIVRLAEEIQADTVVVGGSTKAGHRFVGSLAVHLVRASRWPVTVVPSAVVS